MSLICCPIAVESAAEIPLAVERAARARILGARTIEWRCDGLASREGAGAADAIARLVRDSPLPSIVTVRSSDEGGTSTLAESERLALLARVAKAAGISSAEAGPITTCFPSASWPRASTFS